MIDVSRMEAAALQIRRDVLTSTCRASSGHLGGSLGMSDVFAALYFGLLNHNPADPRFAGRDRLLLSAGHIAPVLYAALANAGYFPRTELTTLRRLDSRLQGHPSLTHGLPGIESASGSLGQGLGVGVGMALAAKMRGECHLVVTIHGDGELQEGSIWESAMSAAHYELDNLIAVVDRNRLQIDGDTECVMRLEPLADKWKAFGWRVFECDGNDIASFCEAFQLAKHRDGKPSVIIANTTMGKGVPSIENNCAWHGKVPSANEIEKFLAELEAEYSR